MTLNKDHLRHQYDEELQELRRQVAEKERNHEAYKKERGGLEVYFRQLESHVPAITPLPPFYKPKTDRKKRVSAVLQTSDSHMGVIQPADEIEGLNEYNPDICEARNMGFARDSIGYIETLRHRYTINELHWFFTGDLISGDIHEELKITNAFPSPQQVIEAAKLHSMQVASVAPHFERVIIHFISADNHARLTKKPQQQEAGINSLNYLVGHIMKTYLQKHGNIEFSLYPVAQKVVKVENTQYLACHGHTVRGWMGVPWYGIERKVGKESTARLAHIMRDRNQAIKEMSHKIGFHKMLHGHFHVDFNHPLFSAAASVQGTTTLDHNAGRYCEPGQPAWLVHPKYGEFARTNFQLKWHS